MAKSKSSSPAGAVAALDFLAATTSTPPRPVCVLFGDEPFLKNQVLEALRGAVLGEDDGEFSSRTFLGDDVEPRTVFDELATVALFGAGGGRLAIVAEADGFVSKHRSALEDYLERPKHSGVFVLEVDSWPSNTRLYKHLAQHGLQIDCNVPDEPRILKWLSQWAERTYQASLAPGAAERLLEVVGPQMGRLDQELAKLSMIDASPQSAPRSVGAAYQTTESRPTSKIPDQEVDNAHPTRPEKKPAITIDLIDQAVGGWRAKTAWQMIDAAAVGDAREALIQLDRLLLAGENPIGLLAQAASPLRRLASAARIVHREQAAGRRISLRQALEQAGVSRWPKALDTAEAQMRQLGARRAGKLYDWLIEADLALKSTSSSGERARLVLEQLFVRLSRQLAPAASKSVRA
jgi:DNA polymerase-3 subunit delta